MSMGWCFWFKTSAFGLCVLLYSVILPSWIISSEALVHYFGSCHLWIRCLYTFQIGMTCISFSILSTLAVTSSTMLTWEILELFFFFFNYSSLSGFDSKRCSILRLGSFLHSHFISDLIIHECLILLNDIS